MIQIILWVLLHAPQIFAIIKEIIDLIRGLKFRERREALDSLKVAFKTAKDTGDYKPLEELHSKLCIGRQCRVRG